MFLFFVNSMFNTVHNGLKKIAIRQIKQKTKKETFVVLIKLMEIQIGLITVHFPKIIRMSISTSR